MRVIVEDLAKESIKDIYDYNSRIAYRNATEIDNGIRSYIHHLETLPYIGRYVPEISNKNLRELIYKKRRNAYRIVYYISEKTATVHILYVVNTKQNFNKILKLHNYFSNLLKF